MFWVRTFVLESVSCRKPSSRKLNCYFVIPSKKVCILLSVFLAFCVGFPRKQQQQQTTCLLFFPVCFLLFVFLGGGPLRNIFHLHSRKIVSGFHETNPGVPCLLGVTPPSAKVLKNMFHYNGGIERESITVGFDRKTEANGGKAMRMLWPVHRFGGDTSSPQSWVLYLGIPFFSRLWID